MDRTREQAVTVTVSDVRGVQRLLVMLVARRHLVTRFDAAGATGGPWRVRLVCRLTEREHHLLRERLRRSPSVLETTWAPDEDPGG